MTTPVLRRLVSRTGRTRLSLMGPLFRSSDKDVVSRSQFQTRSFLPTTPSEVGTEDLPPVLSGRVPPTQIEPHPRGLPYPSVTTHSSLGRGGPLVPRRTYQSQKPPTTRERGRKSTGCAPRYNKVSLLNLGSPSGKRTECKILLVSRYSHRTKLRL